MQEDQDLFKRRRDRNYLYPAGCPCLLHYVPLFPEVTQNDAQLRVAETLRRVPDPLGLIHHLDPGRADPLLHALLVFHVELQRA